MESTKRNKKESSSYFLTLSFGTLAKSKRKETIIIIILLLFKISIIVV